MAFLWPLKLNLTLAAAGNPYLVPLSRKTWNFEMKRGGTKLKGWTDPRGSLNYSLSQVPVAQLVGS
jgi:hypothetical protein